MNTRLDNCNPEQLRLLAEDLLPPTELAASTALSGVQSAGNSSTDWSATTAV